MRAGGAMRTVGRKKEILNRGYSFEHFQGWQYAFVSELPRLPTNPENPFLQNGNNPLGKSQSKIGKNRFAIEKTCGLMGMDGSYGSHPGGFCHAGGGGSNGIAAYRTDYGDGSYGS